MVGGQTKRFANSNKKKRKVKSFPGCRVNKVTEEVEKWCFAVAKTHFS